MKINILSQFKKIFYKSWVQHVLFWAALVLLFTLFRTIRSEEVVLSIKTLLFEIIPLTGITIAVYVNLNFLVPKYLKKKLYIQYTGALLGLMFINAVLVFIVFKTLGPIFLNINHGPHPNRWHFFPAYMSVQIIFVSITSFFHFARENNRLTAIALSVTEIETNRLKAELNSLKAQINPHFLFNTLNNIYSYSLFKSEKTPEMILKLSGLMNYIIYECQADKVDLNKEIDFIHNYMELEKMRVEDSLTIDLQIEDNPKFFKIAPLLFVPFLENAFKHGANVQDQQPYIRLMLDVNEDGSLHFECENLSDVDNHSDLDLKIGGIGLENVKKRLELLYLDNYNLEIDHDDTRFLVKLDVQLMED